MSHPPITPEERFATIVEALRSFPDVTPPSDGPQSKKGFGALGLKIQHKIFAMLVKGKLVVKLPNRSPASKLIHCGPEDEQGNLQVHQLCALLPQLSLERLIIGDCS